MSSLKIRQLCFRCLCSRATCFCGRIVPVRSELRFVLLQHPTERKRSIGTARMTHLCLTGSRLFSGTVFGEHEGVNAILDDPGNSAVVLYPGRDSVNIEECVPEGLPDALPEKFKDAKRAGRNVVVFVIDGTWVTAKRMLQRSPNIARLPRISFNSGKTSEYRIRKQPEAHCLSTLEAVHRVLEILEPNLDASVLLRVFRGMVEAQQGYAERGKIRRTLGALSAQASPGPVAAPASHL